MASKYSKFKEKVNLLLEAKTSILEISSILKKPKSSIYNTIARIKKKKKDINQDSSILNTTQKGRPIRLSTREQKVLNRDLIKDSKATNTKLLLSNNLDISKSTLQRFLKKEGYYVYLAKKKAILNKKKASIRLLIAKQQLKDLENINLKQIIFSDELAI